MMRKDDQVAIAMARQFVVQCLVDQNILKTAILGKALVFYGPQPTGMNALHYAADIGDEMVLDVLLELAKSETRPPVDIFATGQGAVPTPLHIAVMAGHHAAVAKLLADGGDATEGKIRLIDFVLHQLCSAQPQNFLARDTLRCMFCTKHIRKGRLLMLYNLTLCIWWCCRRSR